MLVVAKDFGETWGAPRYHLVEDIRLILFFHLLLLLLHIQLEAGETHVVPETRMVL